MFGKNVRMERIMDRKTGNCVIVPMDHGISIGPTDGLFDMKQTVDAVANGGATAVLMHKGVVRYRYSISRPRLTWELRTTAKFWWLPCPRPSRWGRMPCPST